ncbi:hypothetical protein DTO164E3_4011 [Paecilomyces variotii]|nr:hypothetical protein DTO164E3_4011 [Paecilomyces variotii]
MSIQIIPTKQNPPKSREVVRADAKFEIAGAMQPGAGTLGNTQIPDTSALSYDNTIKGKALQVELTCSQVLSVLPAPGRTILRFLSSTITSGSGECCRVVTEYFDCYQTLLMRGS